MEDLGHGAAGRLRRSDPRTFGADGERRAAEWYEAAGYEILDRNWRCELGEIDLVCRRAAVVVICEVKARRSSAFGDPVEAVTAAKRRRLRRLGAAWLRAHRVRSPNVRFDVVAVRGSEVRVVESAF